MNAHETPAHAVNRPTLPRLDASLALDVMRGLAAVCMIVNHVGTHWLPAAIAHGVGSRAFFVSSAAPVLFFFVTGVAGALRPPTGPWWGRWRTVACLALADLFAAWQLGEVWKLDFFGFIAISTLVVDVVTRTRHAGAWAAGGAVALAALAYIGQPFLLHVSPEQPWPAWFVGVGLQRASYPLTPWLCYPLMGVVVGRLCAGQRDGQARAALRSWPAAPIIGGLALVSLGMLALAQALERHGAHINRWGYVTPGYFVYSLSILPAIMALAAAITVVSRRVATLLSLRGVAAYAVVPMHYGLLTIGITAGLVLVDDVGYALAASAVVVAAFWLSSLYAGALRRRAVMRWAQPMAALIAVACAVALWTVAWPRPSAGWLGVVVLAQLCVGAWLVSLPKRAA